jgi:hypothetical protein
MSFPSHFPEKIPGIKLLNGLVIPNVMDSFLFSGKRDEKIDEMTSVVKVVMYPDQFFGSEAQD